MYLVIKNMAELSLITENCSAFMRLRTLNFTFYQTVLPALNFSWRYDYACTLDCCCGLDVHKDIIYACILKGSPDEEPVAIHAKFRAIQSDLKAMCSWLMEHECFNVAMESTGVYWRPVYEACEEFLEGLKCSMVVNAHHMRNLPGRKSDIMDADGSLLFFAMSLVLSQKD